MSAKALIDGAPVVSLAPRFADVAGRTPRHKVAVADAIASRIRPLVVEAKRDPRFRQASLAAGLASMVVGAWSGKPSLTEAGAHALRFGLERPLSNVRQRSGLSLEPTIGPRRFVITVRRPFD